MLPVWLALQILTLALAVFRIPLYARFPLPIERQATVEMLVMQLAAAALLFPRLLGSTTRWLWIAASSWPMLALAGLLGTEPPQRIAAAAAFVTLWLLMLSLATQSLKNSERRMIGVAVAALWTLGGPVLLYLHAEYGGGVNLWPPAHSSIPYAIAAGPVWAALYHLHARHLLLFSDIPQAVLLTAAAFFLWFKRAQNPITHKLSTKL